jgi:hypothetical protein
MQETFELGIFSNFFLYVEITDFFLSIWNILYFKITKWLNKWKTWHKHLQQSNNILEEMWNPVLVFCLNIVFLSWFIHGIIVLITPYIRMLDSDWLIAVICFTNSGLVLWICRIFTSCRCICIRFNFFSWYLQNRICRFYPSPRRL